MCHHFYSVVQYPFEMEYECCERATQRARLGFLEGKVAFEKIISYITYTQDFTYPLRETHVYRPQTTIYSYKHHHSCL